MQKPAKRVTLRRFVIAVAAFLMVGPISMSLAFHDDPSPEASPAVPPTPASSPSRREQAVEAFPSSATGVTRGELPAAPPGPVTSPKEAMTKKEGEGARSALEVARERELHELQAALPENMHVPYKRSKEELQLQLEDIEEQQQLSTVVESGKATTADYERAYALQAKRFEDEMKLAEYCEKTVAGVAQEELAAHPLCAGVAARVNETRQSNVAALAALRQELHLETGKP